MERELGVMEGGSTLAAQTGESDFNGQNKPTNLYRGAQMCSGVGGGGGRV